MLKTILPIFQDAANTELAVAMKAYQKNKFEFYGIKTPDRRELFKPVLKELKSLSKNETLNLAKQLWKQPRRECHYLAQELLIQNTLKQLEKSDIAWMEWFVLHNSWWDTVDVIAPKIMGVYFKKFPETRQKKTDEWILSGNIWLIRSALLFQLKYKSETDLKLLFNLIQRTCHTKEFFINKAIGWMLRENMKQAPAQIMLFVDKNRAALSNLSVREALKHTNVITSGD